MKIAAAVAGLLKGKENERLDERGHPSA